MNWFKSKIKAFMLTVGEPKAIDALRRFATYMPVAHDIVVWYDCCGRGVDQQFLGELKQFTSNVIVSEQNQGIPAIHGYAMLYLHYDYLIHIVPDCQVKDGFFEKLMRPFEEVDHLAIVGECWHEFNEPYLLNRTEMFIDGISMVSRKAVNEIGSICSSFYNHSCYHIDFHNRAVANGWNIAVINGSCENGSKDHEGKYQWPTWRQDEAHGAKVYSRSQVLNHSEFNWWRDDLGDL